MWKNIKEKDKTEKDKTLKDKLEIAPPRRRTMGDISVVNDYN